MFPRWHNHPELELVYIKEGSGKRYIGQHIEQYDNGDLILLGPHLPHVGFTDRFGKSAIEIVLHFKYEFLGVDFFDSTELDSVKQLLILSANGLSFSGNIKDEVGERLESMFYMTEFEKMIELVKILYKLSKTSDVQTLHAKEVFMSTKSVNT